MLNFDIKPVDCSLTDKLKHKIDNKTKPVGSLGKLEILAIKIGCIQNTMAPQLNKPTVVLFGGDHGIVAEGVSFYPQEVTHQMVFNFICGGAGINVFTRQHNIELVIVDAGINYDFEPHPMLINAKIAKGTQNFMHGPAMTKEQCIEAIGRGAKIVEDINNKGCNIIGFGEMGIGNTSPAAVLFSKFCKLNITECTGRGAGLNDDRLNKKINILSQAIENNSVDDDPISIMSTFGGFEINMMAGAMLKAAELGMILMIDGFIATSALLGASNVDKNVLDYCIFAHTSNERGHKLMLEHFGQEALVNLDMRLGEGTGAAVIYPVIESAVKFLNEMASFDDAKVCAEELKT